MPSSTVLPNCVRLADLLLRTGALPVPRAAYIVIQACRGLARAHGYGLSFADYLARANDEIAVVAQAEHVQAVENIEAIVRVPGIDAILLGPYDLSASLGKPGQVDDPAVVEAIEHVTRTCLEADMPLGYFGVSAEAVRPYMQRGFRLIVAGVDTLMLGTAAQRLLESLKRSM